MPSSGSPFAGLRVQDVEEVFCSCTPLPYRRNELRYACEVSRRLTIRANHQYGNGVRTADTFVRLLMSKLVESHVS
jgi:hypothetical protein